MTSSEPPTVVVVLSDGPLLASRCETLAGRTAVHTRVSRAAGPLASQATTLATGVGPLQHGVLASKTIDAASLQVRPVTARDRRFPAIWTTAAAVGRRTVTIDWPATTADPDLGTSLTPEAVNRVTAREGVPSDTLVQSLGGSQPSGQSFERARRIAARIDISLGRAAMALADAPGLLAVHARSPALSMQTPAYAEQMQDRMTRFLEGMSPTVHVMLVHRLVAAQGGPAAMAATVLSPDVTTCPPRCQLRSICGVLYALTGVTPPAGVSTQWMAADDEPQNRPLPLGSRSDETDWQGLMGAIREHTSAASDGLSPHAAARRTLTTSISTMVSAAFDARHWRSLVESTRLAIDLGPSARMWWLHVLALHRLGRSDALPDAIQALEALDAEAPITAIAQSLLLINERPEAAASLLADFDIRTLQMPAALGTLGRMSLRAGLEPQGIEALVAAIELDTAIPADRAALASIRLKHGDPDRAIRAIGTVGLRSGLKPWRLLRLRILLSLDRIEEAEELAESFAAQYPGADDAETIIRGHRSG